MSQVLGRHMVNQWGSPISMNSECQKGRDTPLHLVEETKSTQGNTVDLWVQVCVSTQNRVKTTTKLALLRGRKPESGEGEMLVGADLNFLKNINMSVT